MKHDLIRAPSLEANEVRSPTESGEGVVKGEKSYQIRFSGEYYPPLNLRTVQRRLAALYGVPLEEVAPLFKGSVVILKELSTYRDAQRYHDALRDLGLVVTLKEIQIERSDPDKGQVKEEVAEEKEVALTEILEDITTLLDNDEER